MQFDKKDMTTVEQVKNRDGKGASSVKDPFYLQPIGGPIWGWNIRIIKKLFANFK